MRISDWSSDVCSSDPAAHPEIDQRRVLMQVFQKRDAVLCGIDEALAVLRVGTGRWRDEHAAEQLFDRFLEAKFASRGAGRDNRRAAVKATMELEEQLDDQWIGEWSELAVTALRSEEHTSELQSLMRNSYAGLCLKQQKTDKHRK